MVAAAVGIALGLTALVLTPHVEVGTVSAGARKNSDVAVVVRGRRIGILFRLHGGVCWAMAVDPALAAVARPARDLGGHGFDVSFSAAVRGHLDAQHAAETSGASR